MPKDRILERAACAFFAGRGDNGAVRWSANGAGKRPVFADAANGVGWNLSVSYNAGLRRYILCTQHTAIASGNLGIFDAPEPWGPWTTVAFETGWGTDEIGRTSWLWHFPTKWLSADGATFTMVFTGKFENGSWNTVRGRFVPLRTGRWR